MENCGVEAFKYLNIASSSIVVDKKVKTQRLSWSYHGEDNTDLSTGTSSLTYVIKIHSLEDSLVDYSLE